MNTYLAPDIFVIPDDGDDSFIAYAPLIGVAAHVNGRMAALLEGLHRQGDGQTRVEDDDVRADLLALGLLSRHPYVGLEPDSRSQAFDPTNVSLFLTSACNLGCTYCYASANESPASMSWPMAERAIDLVFENALRLDRKKVGVVLHGGGEATLEWDLLTRIVERTRNLARQRGISANISLGTNGIMSPSHAEWLTSNIDSATVSLDGPPDIHNRNRPTVGGQPSFHIVARTLRIFDAKGLHYGLRLTVTEDWVDRLPDAVEYICTLVRAKTLQAEPVFPSGRAGRNQMSIPRGTAFVEAFRRAAKIAKSRGRELTYSGARLGKVTDRFCEAAGRSFAVTPSGDVSSCYEVSENTDPRNEGFFWGSYDAENHSFDLDEERRKTQTQMTVHGKPHCSTCFCKWHCAGDCSAKLAQLGDPRDTSLNPRCEVNRALTRDQLILALRRGSDIPRDRSHPDEQASPGIAEGTSTTEEIHAD